MTHIAAQPVVGDPKGIEQELGGDLLPKGAQLFEPCLGWVARDQRRVDGADRNSGHPVRMQVCLGEGLIHASLKGPECAPSLQHQSDAVEGWPWQISVALQ